MFVNETSPIGFQVGGVEDSDESDDQRLNQLEFSLSNSVESEERLELVREIDDVLNKKRRKRRKTESDNKESNNCLKPESSYPHSSIPFDLDNNLGFQRLDSETDLFYPSSHKKHEKLKIVGGRFAVGRLLGEGSYAKVKEVLDIHSLERRAIKIMKCQKLRRIPSGEENVKREIEIQSKLRHKNVMRLFEVFKNVEKEKLYLVLEYCSTVLKDLMNTCPLKHFSSYESHNYFKQLLTGLSYLHSKRVIHSDIKPGNLLLSNNDLVKIADFGVAQQISLFSPSLHISNSAGTASFQPPEIASADLSTFDGTKVDVWASGVTLFNFITGRLPFENFGTLFELYNVIARCEIVYPSESVELHQPLLKSLITSILNKNPDERPDVEGLLKHDWVRKRHPNLNSQNSSKSSPSNCDEILLIPYLANHHQLFRHQEESKTPFLDLQNLTPTPQSSSKRSSLKSLSSRISRNSCSIL